MKYDKVGIWSEIKLEIIKDYASAYTTILNKQDWCKGYAYIDAFAGAGQHISRRTGELIKGSPLNALEITPPFTEYHFIDLDESRAKVFEELAREDERIHSYHGDCNNILAEEVFPQISYSSFKRALCLLDPYGLALKWDTIKTAGDFKTIDILINFPIMDINRNIIFENLAKADPDDIARMNALWGNESWKEILYSKTLDLFGETQQVKIDNYEGLAKAFQKRLKYKAGFKFIPTPILMRNKTNGPLFFLFFASHKSVAGNIIKHIFKKYSQK
jgi:three-Cys-motif partner protein